jgi:hypothetical protein
LVREWPHGTAKLLTCNDLSRPGWKLPTPATEPSVAIVDGQVTPEDRISGVFTTVPYIFPEELVHIDPQERQYVAQEMTATLRFWMTGLRCRKLNSPSAGSLAGPSWRPEQWVMKAAERGLPINPVRRTTDGQVKEVDGAATGSFAPEKPVDGTRCTLTLLGNRWIGPRNLVPLADRLVIGTGLRLLQIAFLGRGDEWAVVGAQPFADLENEEVRRALYAYFGGASS